MLRYCNTCTMKRSWLVVIGKQARNVSEADATRIMSRATPCVNHDAIRDYLGNHHRPKPAGKSRDGVMPKPSTIVPKEAIPDPHNLTLRTFVNGDLRQQGTTALIPFLQRALLIAY
ncbi:fumarylacetoacetate hydrolase family protein [Shigella flexneri]